jgi:hypothetical protein
MEMFGAGLGFGAHPVRRPALDRLGPNGRLILVPGGETVLLEVMRGDRLTFFDPVGGQRVSIAAFDATGAPAPALLTFSDDAPSMGDAVAAVLNQGQARLLLQRGIDPRRARL